MTIRVKTSILNEKEICYSHVISKGFLNIFLFLYFLEVDILYQAKDWMIFKGIKILDDGRRFKVYDKNPKYMNVKTYVCIFPKQ